jgi:pilus assembly protein CpaE
MTIRFGIYYRSPETGAYLQGVIKSLPETEVVELDTLENLPVKLRVSLDVILLEFEGEEGEWDRWMRETVSNPLSPPIFIYLKEISTSSLMRALRLGVKECFTYPIPKEELEAALKRLPPRLETAPGAAKTTLTTLLGCKGGAGSTFLTANLGYLLSRGPGAKVLMLDLDLRYGQLSYFFDVQPRYTMIEALENLERPDTSYLQGIFHSLDPNLHLLAAPPRIDQAETISPEHLEKILQEIKNLSQFSWVLVDAGNHLDDFTLKILELSEVIILVATPSIPGLSNTKKLLEMLHLLGLEAAPIHLLLNQWSPERELTLPQVVQFLGREVTWTVSCDPGPVGRSINEGRPLAETSSRNPVSRDLKAIVAALTGETAPESPANGSFCRTWLRRLKGRE